jgi:hypothetical protein
MNLYLDEIDNNHRDDDVSVVCVSDNDDDWTLVLNTTPTTTTTSTGIRDDDVVVLVDRDEEEEVDYQDFNCTVTPSNTVAITTQKTKYPVDIDNLMISFDNMSITKTSFRSVNLIDNEQKETSRNDNYHDDEITSWCLESTKADDDGYDDKDEDVTTISDSSSEVLEINQNTNTTIQKGKQHFVSTDIDDKNDNDNDTKSFVLRYYFYDVDYVVNYLLQLQRQNNQQEIQLSLRRQKQQRRQQQKEQFKVQNNYIRQQCKQRPKCCKMF